MLSETNNPVRTPLATDKSMLSEAQEMNKDLIDEILNNNQRDEGGLKDILNMLLKKPSQTREDVADALRKIGEDQLAESLYVKCKTHHLFLVFTCKLLVSVPCCSFGHEKLVVSSIIYG